MLEDSPRCEILVDAWDKSAPLLDVFSWVSPENSLILDVNSPAVATELRAITVGLFGTFLRLRTYRFKLQALQLLKKPAKEHSATVNKSPHP